MLQICYENSLNLLVSLWRNEVVIDSLQGILVLPSTTITLHTNLIYDCGRCK